MSFTCDDTYVYLDYAATAPLTEEVAAAMAPYQVGGRDNILVNANANSLHTPGRKAFAALEAARKTVANALGATRPTEIIFTSGATEADDTAIIGLAIGAKEVLRLKGALPQTPHVIVSAIEHDAVLAPAHKLETLGFRVTRLGVDAQGFVEVRALEEALSDDTVLVSVQAANSEVGSIQPIEQLAALTHARGALFHTDAVQVLGKAPVNVAEWDVDAASFSAHKLGGPKGVGILYLRARTPFEPYMLGGGQESGLRSGTQNVAGVVGCAAAVFDAQSLQEAEAERLRPLRDYLYAELTRIDGVDATVGVEPGSYDFLPNIVHVLVKGLESETLILRLDMLGFGVSGGSACSSLSLEPSHVLRAMGITTDRAREALRISMGRYTTEEDVHRFVDALKQACNWE